MPFNHVPKNPGDLIKSEDWNEALDAIVALFAKFNAGSGHKHSGSGEDAPPIETNGVADNAITTQKIRNSAVTAQKLAAGLIPEIGVASTQGMAANGASIPVPSGFKRSECIFFASIKHLQKTSGNQTFTSSISWDDDGKVTINGDNIGTAFAGLAIGKKGGW
ncbi:MAG: hypothetical protein AAFZ15_19990 [Bacteroidota bacterium]